MTKIKKGFNTEGLNSKMISNANSTLPSNNNSMREIDKNEPNIKNFNSNENNENSKEQLRLSMLGVEINDPTVEFTHGNITQLNN